MTSLESTITSIKHFFICGLIGSTMVLQDVSQCSLPYVPVGYIYFTMAIASLVSWFVIICQDTVDVTYTLKLFFPIIILTGLFSIISWVTTIPTCFSSHPFFFILISIQCLINIASLLFSMTQKSDDNKN